LRENFFFAKIMKDKNDKKSTEFDGKWREENRSSDSMLDNQQEKYGL
jgi:hypothetical protein